jgi:hypothetical protein
LLLTILLLSILAIPFLTFTLQSLYILTFLLSALSLLMLSLTLLHDLDSFRLPAPLLLSLPFQLLCGLDVNLFTGGAVAALSIPLAVAALL